MAAVTLRLGYTPWCPIDGMPFTEASFTRQTVLRKVDSAELGLVLVDVWNWGWPNGPTYDGFQEVGFERGASHARRKQAIVEDVIRHLLAWARSAGIPVFHANLVHVLQRYPGWEVSTTPAERARLAQRPARGAAADPPEAAWPGTDWEHAWRDEHERAVWGTGTEWDRLQRQVAVNVDIPAAAQPGPGEWLVFGGDQFHRILAELRVRVLLYAGFETDQCLQFKSYGLANMQQRGYLCCAIRDATTTFESGETLAGLRRTQVALQNIEARFGYTVSAEDLMTMAQGMG